MNSTLTKTGNWVSITLDIPSSGLVGYPSYWGVPQVRCLEYQDDSHNRAPVCAQHYSTYLSKSGRQRTELEERHDMGVSDSAFYWWLHYSHPHSTTHSTTNNHYSSNTLSNKTSCQWVMEMMSKLPPALRRRNIKWMHAHVHFYASSLSASLHLLWGMLDVLALFRIRHRPLVLSVGSLWELGFR